MPQDDASLCSDCEALDWRNLARSPTDYNFSCRWFGKLRRPLGRFVKNMKTPYEQLNASACRLCRILSIIRDTPRDQEWEPGSFYDSHLQLGPLESRIRISPSTGSWTKPALLWIPNVRPAYGRDWKHIALFESRYQAESCKIQPLINDFSWMKGTIADCQQHHSNCSKTATTPAVPGLRVIDCQASCSDPSIILAPGSCQYVALSYVWGGPAHVVDDEVAPVIKDSMKVTLELGLQYLWVDRYCIPQDSEEKHQFIQAMDEIYSNAVLTITAAAGTSARDGLPGISDVPRVAQVEVEAGGCTFLEIPCTLNTVQASIWATRAWTYQEGLLSTRCLIFTESGVLYRCAGRVLDESLQRLVPDGQDAYMWQNYFTDMFTVDTITYPGSRYLGYQIEQYTQRQLSYPQDSLNAFLGILRAYGRMNKPVQHFWGLPCYEGTPDLQWYHQRPASRRPDFPSWSWAGWAGGIAWDYTWNATKSYYSPIFRPILVETPMQSSSMDHAHWSSEQAKHIYVTGAMLSLQFCTPEQTERIRNIANHLDHHSDAGSPQARERGPYAMFEFFPGIFAAVPSFPDSEDDLRDGLVGLLEPEAYNQSSCKIANVIILKPIAGHFERVGFLNMRNVSYYGIYMDDAGALVAKDELPWGQSDIEGPWLKKVERRRICLK